MRKARFAVATVLCVALLFGLLASVPPEGTRAGAATDTWVKTYGGSADDVFRDVKATADGGFVAVGYSTSFDWDLGSPYGGKEAFIQKYSAAGAVQWTSKLGGTGDDAFEAVALLPSGGYLAAGWSCSDDGDFLYGKSGELSYNKGACDGVVAEYAANGSLSWFENIGGSMNDYIYSIIVSATGGYAAVGSSESAAFLPSKNGTSDAFIYFSGDATYPSWKKNVGGTAADTFRGITQALDGGLVAVGNTADATLIPSVGNATGSAVIAKFTMDGTQAWLSRVGGSTADSLESVTAAPDGGVVAVGYSSSGGVGILASLGMADGIIAKFDASGNQQWLVNAGGSNNDYLYAITASSPGYLIAGNALSGDGWLSRLLAGQNAFVAKIDESGNRAWVVSTGGGKHDHFYSVSSFADGSYFAAGTTNSDDGDITAPRGGYDGLVAKGFDSTAVISPIPTLTTSPTTTSSKSPSASPSKTTSSTPTPTQEIPDVKEGSKKYTKAPTPTISGVKRVGKKLTAKAGTWAPAKVQLTYNWYRNGKKIVGAYLSTYTLTASDQGKRITVKVTGYKDGYTTTAKTSKQTGKIAVGKLSRKPLPNIVGVKKVGSKLTAKPGLWKPAVKKKYQWYRNGKKIKGATKATYKLKAADAGKRITVKLTASRAGYKSVSKISKAVKIAALPKPTPTPVPTPTPSTIPTQCDNPSGKC
ncbi:MAG: hypothetical protein LBR20_04225 [Propionibacteriaceae bacterium]|jgi:hypothetical protein|nr:hypothetical protein [Propionibacteriaceae bacterium]